MNYYYDSCGKISLWCSGIFYTHLSAAHIHGRHKIQEGQTKSLCRMKLLQALPSVFVSTVAFCLCLCVCSKWSINEGDHLFPLPVHLAYRK